MPPKPTKPASMSAGSTPPARLWRPSGAGTLKSGRWELVPDDRDWWGGPGNTRARLKRGVRMKTGEWPSPAPRFTYETVAVVPDTATGSGEELLIVSGRLRSFLETHAPGACEFLPARIEGPGRARLHPEYWAVNWLRLWDCQPDPELPELDSARVPAGEHVGVVAGEGWSFRETIICTDEMKKRLQREGFVGLRFEPVHLALGPNDTVRRRNPATGKVEPVERRLLPHDRLFDVDAFLEGYPGTTWKSDVPGADALSAYVTMHSAMGGVDVRTLRRLLEAGHHPNASNGHENVSPILVLIRPKTPAVIALLSAYGADWNLSNRAGVTPLVAAARDRDREAVAALLAAGARVDYANPWGCTALHQLCADLDGVLDTPRRTLATVRQLLDAGADPERRDGEGLTPLDHADRVVAGVLKHRPRDEVRVAAAQTLRDAVARLFDRAKGHGRASSVVRPRTARPPQARPTDAPAPCPRPRRRSGSQ